MDAFPRPQERRCPTSTHYPHASLEAIEVIEAVEVIEVIEVISFRSLSEDCVQELHRAGAGFRPFPRKAEYVVPKSEYFVALFWLGMGYCLFRIPPSEIIDSHIPLDEIFPEASQRLTEEMALAKSFHRRVYFFERFLSEIIIDSRQISAQHKLLIKTINQASENSFDDNVQKACQDEFTCRHIRRLYIKYLGISPNLISRIIRYQKTLHFLNVHPADHMAGLATEQGYFDQSHLIKEFKRFQGVTPTEFIRRLRA